MNFANGLNTQTYERVANVILLRQYHMNNITDLISKIFVLMKIDMNNRTTTIRFIKSRVDRYIYGKIANLNNLFEILRVLFCIADNHKRYINRLNYNKNRNIKNIFN